MTPTNNDLRTVLLNSDKYDPRHSLLYPYVPYKAKLIFGVGSLTHNLAKTLRSGIHDYPDRLTLILSSSLIKKRI